MEDNNFIKRIVLKLSPKVLQHISANIFRDSASAFKELASNSFDAGATKFEIKLVITRKDEKFDLDKIIIKDNGSGMSFNDFQYIFMNIGNSKKVKDLEYDSQDKFNANSYNRPIIGRIGIGMFSIVSASNEFIVESKVKGQKEAYKATTKLSDFSRLTATNFELEKFNSGDAEIDKIEPTEKDESYTKITIGNFKRPFLEELMNGFGDSKAYDVIKLREIDSGKEYNDQSEASFSEFFNDITKNTNIDELESKIDTFIFNLSLMLPIEYLHNGPFKECVEVKPETEESKNLIENLKERLRKYNFSAYFTIRIRDHNSEREGGFKLFKPISFPNQNDIDKYGVESLRPRALLYRQLYKYPNELNEITEADISMYVYHQGKRIIPLNYRGILFRVYDVAVGKYEYERLRPFTASVFQFQTSFEIFMDKGFQSAVNIDRESLHEGSYAYMLAKTFFNTVLKEREKDAEEESKAKSETELKSTPMDNQVSTKITTEDEAEQKFSNYLKEVSSKQIQNPVLTHLNEFKKEFGEKRRETKALIEKNNPLFNILKKELGYNEMDTLEIEYETSNSYTDNIQVEKEGDKILVKIPEKYKKDIKVSFQNILVAYKLSKQRKSEAGFDEFLDELYKFYAK